MNLIILMKIIGISNKMQVPEFHSVPITHMINKKGALFFGQPISKNAYVQLF